MLLALRGTLPAFAVVGWLGRISYRVFLVHVPIVAAAWALHVSVEEPGIRLGRRLGRTRVSPRP